MADAAALRLGVSRGPGGATIVDAGIALAGGIEAGRRIAELCMGGLGPGRHRGRLACRRTVPPRGCGSPSRCWPASPASMPAGACHTARARTAGAPWPPGPGRARAAKEALFGELGYRDPRPSACFVLETDRPPPDGLIAEVAGRVRAARARAGLRADADHQPRRHRADRGPGARGGAAQGARAGLPAGRRASTGLGRPPCRRRPPISSPPWAGPTTPCCTAARCSCSSPARRRGARPCRAAAELSSRDHGKPFAELFAAAGQRFLQARLDAVQPGQGHRDRPVDRPQLRRRASWPRNCWRARSGRLTRRRRTSMAPDILVLGAAGWHWAAPSAPFEPPASRRAADLCRCSARRSRGAAASGWASSRPAATGPGALYSGAARSSRSLCASASCTPWKPAACVWSTRRPPSSAASTSRPPASAWRLPGCRRRHLGGRVPRCGRGVSSRARLREGVALVLKPLFGAQGKGLRLLRAARRRCRRADEVGGVWYLQRYVGGESAWRDFRVMVIGGEPVAAMARHGIGWITNIRQGGRPEAVPASGELARLAVAAAAAVGCDHAGVDLIEDRDGRLLVLEVNSMPAWQGLQSVGPVDIAGIASPDGCGSGCADEPRCLVRAPPARRNCGAEAGQRPRPGRRARDDRRRFPPQRRSRGTRPVRPGAGRRPTHSRGVRRRGRRSGRIPISASCCFAPRFCAPPRPRRASCADLRRACET